MGGTWEEGHDQRVSRVWEGGFLHWLMDSTSVNLWLSLCLWTSAVWSLNLCGSIKMRKLVVPGVRTTWRLRGDADEAVWQHLASQWRLVIAAGMVTIGWNSLQTRAASWEAHLVVWVAVATFCDGGHSSLLPTLTTSLYEQVEHSGIGGQLVRWQHCSWIVK